MKAYRLKAVGRLEYEDTAVPAPGPGWVLVKVGAAGICGSDLPRIFETGTYHFPTIPGHEFAGTVVDAGDDEGRNWIGKRVGVFPLIPCRTCFVCREGRYEMCRDYDYLGSRRDGGFAEYVAVPVWNLLELPEAMSLEEAAMLEPASVALHAVRRLELSPDDTVALYGLGTIGLIITQWLHIYGISNVYAVGHHPGHGEQMKRMASEDYAYLNLERQASMDARFGVGPGQLASEDECFGGSPDQLTSEGECSGGSCMRLTLEGMPGNRKEPTRMAASDPVGWIREQTGGAGASVAIDCAGTAESVTNCLNSVRPGGQILLVGNPKGEMRLDQASYWKILRNQIRVTGTWNSTFCHDPEDDWHRVTAAVAEGKLRLSGLITHRLPFDELAKGLAMERNHTEYYNKVLICAE